MSTSVAKYELRKIAYLNLQSKFIVFPLFLYENEHSEFEVYFLTKAQTKFSLSEKCSLVGSFEYTSLQVFIMLI